MLADVDVVAALVTCSARQQGLATSRQVVEGGGSTSALSRAVKEERVVRVAPHVYSVAPLPAWPRFVVTESGVAEAHVARVRAALLSLGPAAAARRRTSAALRGWGMLREPVATVEVAVPHGARGRSSHWWQTRQVRDLVSDAVPVGGARALPATPALTTALDCLLELPALEAVVVVDSALRAGDVTLDELRALLDTVPGVAGAAKARRALGLCDPDSGSVLESVLRVRLVRAGVVGFATQGVIRSREGRRLLRVDFLFEEACLVVETDGARWHPDGRLDRSTDNLLAAAGWRVMRFTWAEVVHEGPRVVALIREALTGSGTSAVHLSRAATAVAA